MNILMNIIVLIFEVLYYSMFMYYTKKEGKFWKYILLFSLITIIGLFIGTDNLYSYLLLVLMILYGLKYIVSLKVSLYDMLIIFIMLILKVLIETPFYVILCIYTDNNFVLTIPSSVVKILLLILFKSKMNFIYNKLRKLWYNNNFYIRYIFSIFMFLFVIFGCIFLIIKLGGE